jgi:hypothetical protein
LIKFARYPKLYNMKTALNLLVIGILMLFVSCAATYKPINPQLLSYPLQDTAGTFSYMFDVIKTAGNNKLAKKESRSYIRVAAIKFVNHTGKTLVYGMNYKLYSGLSEVSLLSADTIEAAIQQAAPSYLLYLLLTPMKLTTSENGVVQSSVPIGFVIGPAIALGNILVSSSANKNFLSELQKNSLIGRQIKDGDTCYALIGVPNTGFAPLTLKVF